MRRGARWRAYQQHHKQVARSEAHLTADAFPAFIAFAGSSGGGGGAGAGAAGAAGGGASGAG